jgi:hypothetical protein
MVTSVMPLNNTYSSSLISSTPAVREFAKRTVGASSPNDSLNHQIKKSSSKMTRKLFRDLRRLDDHAILFNPGTIYHIESSDDDARSESDADDDEDENEDADADERVRGGRIFGQFL